MKTLKVGAWWNSLDTNQQEAFKRIWSTGDYDVNPIRKFLTSAKKKFGDQVEYVGKFNVSINGNVYTYSGSTDNFYQLSK